jgi:hypothetical protein
LREAPGPAAAGLPVGDLYDLPAAAARCRRDAPSAACFGRKNRGMAQLLLIVPSAQARVHDRSNADGDPANPESKPESATKKKKNDN